MAIVYGLTDQGLVVKSRLVIRDEINSALRLAFGNSINLSDRSIFGQIVGIITDRLGDLWELLETVASSQDPDKATKSLLDAICLITGTFRPEALASQVTLTFTGVDSTVVAAESEFTTASTLKSFVTVADVTLVTVTAWVALTVYEVDDRVENGGNIYQCITAGTSAASGGPTGETPEFTVDGTCFWTFLGTGAAAVDAEASSVELGPIVGVARDITEIVTTTSGLESVINLEDAVLGRVEAADADLRTLRVVELSAPGSSPFDALRGQLLRVANVTAVTLFPNNTDVTDGDGVPPHSVEALVRGGEDQDIFDALLAGVAAGIGTHGTTVGTATNSQGSELAQKFSRAVDVPVYVRISVTVDEDSYPSDGDLQVENEIINYGAVQNSGRDAVPAAVSARAFRVVGVLDVSQLLIYTDVIGTPVAWASTTGYVATAGSRSVVTNQGRSYICITTGTSAGSGGPTGTGTDITDGTAHWSFLGNAIVITSRQHAEYQTGNVEVVSTPGTA